MGNLILSLSNYITVRSKLADKHRLLTGKQKTGKVVFEDSWEEFFSKFNLRSFDDFFNYSSGKIVNKNRKRTVIMLTLGDGHNQKTFFMKCFQDPQYKDIFSAWYNFGKPTSQAAVEWNNARLLLSLGVDTYRPVCFGEKTQWGLEKKSFFVTEKLNSMELTEFVSQKWLQLEQTQQKKIVSDIAKLIRRIHSLNIRLPDLYLWHIFIREDSLNGSRQLSIIDLHRMARNIMSEPKIIKDVGKFYWSMPKKYFNDEIKNFFLNDYMGDNWNDSKTAFVKRVQKRAAIIEKRRRQKRY